MAKVFRIFKALSEKDTHWFTSDPIGRGIIDSIEVQETEGKKLPTSIPSPFAQIDLIRSAFITVNNEFAVNGVDLDSHKDAHRLVSNALDIGQILFNYDTFSSNLSIEYWDKESSLDSLLNSDIPEHKHLGKTLKLFLTSSDSRSFNFDKLSKIFILKYNNQVIGGTSPKTLFFASTNSQNINVEINCGNDKMLDDKPLALHKRDKEFIKYLFGLKSIKGFAHDFPEFSKYLDNVLSVINAENIDFSNELRSISSVSGYFDLTLPDNPGIRLQVLPNYTLFQNKVDNIDGSGFFINSDKVEKRPMVLPVETFTENIIYTTEEWLSDTKVPYFDERNLEDRTLPRVNIKYPYLTISDFLEDTIVELPYNIDSKKYFGIEGFESYLLPIKKEFFKYFDAKEFVTRDMVNIKNRAGDSVEVSLKIPIQNNKYITYQRIYNKNNSAIQPKDSKFGKIIESNFTLGVYPFVNSPDQMINYSVAISEKNKNHQIQNIKLINSLDSGFAEVKIRDRSSTGNLYTKHILTNDYFDVIQCNFFEANNILIPIMKQHNGTTKSFKFAIDFGTTNTHIEYLHSQGGLPETYKFENDQFAFLRNADQELRGKALINSQDCEAALTQELLDNSLGIDRYEFPFRSVILENKTINYNNPNYLYGDVNIGFDYEKFSIREHLTRRSNLKWMHLDENFNNKRIEMFIRQLLELCKNKVLHNDGDLTKTTITWLYPTSMSYTHRTRFEDIWEDQFRTVFPDNSLENLRSIPESIAPFYYYQNFEGLMNQTAPTVSIDIGGGTSDITIFEQNKPKVVSSFKFAGNSIFGDGYNSNINANGFVKKYYQTFKTILEDNKNHASEELGILNEIYEKYQSSDDISNFLFSLEDNFNLLSKDIKINYTSKLRNDEDLKIVFIVFYAALIYHVAQIMKLKGMSVPKNILFSGTASKTSKILDSNLTRLTKMFNYIFNYIFKIENSSVEIHIDDSPKVLTAKGALKSPDQFEDFEEIIFSFPGNEISKGDIKGLTYSDLDETKINSIEHNIKEFYSLLDTINQKMSFNKSFGASQRSMDKFKHIRNQNLKDYILTGLEERKKDVKDENLEIEETLFFYSFTGLLNKLASEVVS